MMTKPRIALVVGHDEHHPGAFGVLPINQYEYFYNLDFCQKLSVVLSDLFEATIYLRDGLGIDKTYDELEKIGPDACMEFHFNSSADNRARGSECLCALHSCDLAKVIQKKICEVFNRTGNEDRGVEIQLNPEDRGFHSTSRLKCPNVLLEPFFGSNVEDCQIAIKTQQDLCLAIRDSLVNYFTTIGIIS